MVQLWYWDYESKNNEHLKNGLKVGRQKIVLWGIWSLRFEHGIGQRRIALWGMVCWINIMNLVYIPSTPLSVLTHQEWKIFLQRQQPNTDDHKRIAVSQTSACSKEFKRQAESIKRKLRPSIQLKRRTHNRSSAGTERHSTTLTPLTQRVIQCPECEVPTRKGHLFITTTIQVNPNLKLLQFITNEL